MLAYAYKQLISSGINRVSVGLWLCMHFKNVKTVAWLVWRLISEKNLQGSARGSVLFQQTAWSHQQWIVFGESRDTMFFFHEIQVFSCTFFIPIPGEWRFSACTLISKLLQWYVPLLGACCMLPPATNHIDRTSWEYEIVHQNSRLLSGSVSIFGTNP